MGITVALQSEDGTRLAVVEDPTNVLHRVLPDAEDPTFQWAGTIDWYGDTTFNAAQAGALRREWSRLISAAQDATDAALLQRVDEIIGRAANGVHLYVKFYGD